MHREVMLAAELSAETVVGNASAVSAAIMILLASCFLAPGILAARFGPTLFLAVRFLLGWPHIVTRLRLLRPLLLLGPLLALLLGVRGPGFVLLRRLHFILSRRGLAWLLLCFRAGLILPGRLLLPLGLFLFRFFFLLFVVLRVKNRRTREQSRENA